MPVRTKRIIDRYVQPHFITKPNIAPTPIFTKQAYPDYHYTKFHQEWQNLVENHNRVFICAPVSSSKTSMVTQLYSLKRSYDYPEIRILVVSSTADQAQSMNLESRGKVNGELLKYYGKAAGFPWNTKCLTLRFRQGNYREPNIMYIGVGTKPEGYHFHIIILDDIVNIENSSTVGQRENLTRWVDLAIKSRLLPGGQIIVVGTRFHPEDYYNDLIEKGYVTNSYSAAILPNGKSYWPQIWPLDELKSREKEMGKALFDACFMNDPRGLVGAEAYNLDTVHFLPENKMPHHEECIYHFGSIDAARTVKERSDFTVLQVWGIQDYENPDRFCKAEFLNRKYYMLAQQRGKWSHTAVETIIENMSQKYQITDWVLESVFEENDLACRLIDLFPHLNFILYRPRIKKYSRFLEIQSIPNNGLLYLLDIPEVKKEFANFPGGDHDDQCDTAHQAMKHAKYFRIYEERSNVAIRSTGGRQW